MRNIKKSLLRILAFLSVTCIIAISSACGGSSTQNANKETGNSQQITIEMGKVSGCVMYKTSLSGTPRADTGSFVQLIPVNIQEFPEVYEIWCEDGYEEYGIYATTTDSVGDFEFTDIPVGEYRMVVISKNANWSGKQVIENLSDISVRLNKLYGEHIGGLVKVHCTGKYAMVFVESNYSVGYDITVKADKAVKKNVTCTDYSSIMQ